MWAQADAGWEVPQLHVQAGFPSKTGAIVAAQS